jgi:hypothetical protein
LKYLILGRIKDYLAETCCNEIQKLPSSRLLSTNAEIKIHKSVIFLVDLYQPEVLCRMLREEHGLRVFENRGLREVFGPKWDEVTGEWRRLHNEELNDLYCSQNIIRMNKSRRTG